MIGYGSESGSYPLPQSKALRAYFRRHCIEGRAGVLARHDASEALSEKVDSPG